MFLRHLITLRYESCPDYALISKAFTALYEECGGNEDTEWDFGCSDEDLLIPARCVCEVFSIRLCD